MGNLFDCLAGIYTGEVDDSILDKYSDIRRQKYNEIINPVSSENIVRLFGQDPDKALENDEFLKLCKRAEEDVEFSKQLQTGVNLIKHDFTQYYRSHAQKENGNVDGSPQDDSQTCGLDKIKGINGANPTVQVAAVGVSD